MKGDHVFKCHNCGITRSFSNFLKDNAPHVYDEYVMERYKEGTIGGNVPKPDLTQFVHTPKFKKRTVDLERLSSLNKSHPAKQYALGSCLLYTSPSPRDPKTSRMPSSA